MMPSVFHVPFCLSIARLPILPLAVSGAAAVTNKHRKWQSEAAVVRRRDIYRRQQRYAGASSVRGKGAGVMPYTRQCVFTTR